MTQLVVRPANRTEWPVALDVLFQHDDPASRHDRGIRTEALLRSGELDPSGLLIACRDSEIVGTILCTPAPGAVGLVWPPEVIVAPERRPVEDQLVERACRWLKEKGVKLAQLLVLRQEEHRAEPLLRHGFYRVTTLIYLSRSLSEALPTAETDLRFETFSSETAGRFAETVSRTYEGSHDCPEVNGVRTVEEILAGHRAQGVFAPERWWLVYSAAGKEPVGVLLVNALNEEPGWDLIYMGLVPEARGRGLGRQLTLHALHAARAQGLSWLELCVDGRNFFARGVYETLGFRLVTERLIYLAALGSAPLCGQL
jgi:mycothiol synthase